MKKYTIQEIDEIRAKAIFDFEQVNNDSSDWENFANKEDYLHIAEAIRKADEEAGILILVDDSDEPKEGDVLFNSIKDTSYFIADYVSKRDGETLYTINCAGRQLIGNISWGGTIIQRNKTPVYQCKKEEQDEKTN